MSDFYTDEVEDTTDMENDLRTEGGASSSRLGVPGYHHHHHPSSIKQRQQELIDTHPFGIKIWKPALYKKYRSIESVTWNDLHSIPGSLKNELSFGNILWALLFGWWMALIYIFLGLFLLGPVYLVGLILSKSSSATDSTSVGYAVRELLQIGEYILLLLNLAGYVFFPFGKFIAKRPDESSEFPTLETLDMPSPREPLIASHDYNHSAFSPNYSANITSSGISISSQFEERDQIPSSSHGNSDYDELDPLISPSSSNDPNLAARVKSLFNNVFSGGPARVFFFCCSLLILGPVHLITSGLMFFFVFPIPMGKLNYYLLRHLLRHPLQLSAHWCVDEPGAISTPQAATAVPATATRPRSMSQPRPRSIFFFQADTALSTVASSSVLPTIMATPSIRPTSGIVETDYQIVLCTYRAMGFEYTKYTVDGVNIILINLLSMIVFTIFDFYYLGPKLDFTGIASKTVIFLCGVLSTIPLSYFIGMAVSSITTHTGSVAIGSVVNATFGSIIEILLYAFGLMNGKEDLVQGAMIGSFLLGLLALPGVSMFFGGLRRPEQRFNAKSASVTSTMLVVAIICVFTPTIFQNIHGSYNFNCKDCPDEKGCRTCIMTQPHPTEDPVYLSSTRPLMYICASILVLTYGIGLWFTLRTHSKRIYGKKKSRRRRQRHDRIPSLHIETEQTRLGRSSTSSNAVGESRRSLSRGRIKGKGIPTTSFGDPSLLSGRETANAGPSTLQKRRIERNVMIHEIHDSSSSNTSSSDDEGGHNGGHDNPGWSLFKSAMILLFCTVAYSLIAEILIDSIDIIIEDYPIGEKTLGLTVLAILPTVTEFYNAIAFAVNGNIVLALEIGSAYAIQVALLQIPALVAFSAYWNYAPRDKPQFGAQLFSSMLPRPASGITSVALQSRSEFTLVFPRWEFYCLAFAVFLLTYVYLEGKSNYFKGALLLLTYIVLITAFFFEP